MGRDGVTEARMSVVKRLKPIANRLGVPVAHLALKWALRDGRVTSALVGARTVEQIDDSLNALSGPDLSASELAEIETALGAG